MDELAALTGSGGAWALRILRRNLELALRGPRTLESAENQVDFVEELAEAVWDEVDPGFRQVVLAADTPEATRAREARRQEVVERLDHLTDQLCRAVEGWCSLTAVTDEGVPATTADPQAYHSI